MPVNKEALAAMKALDQQKKQEQQLLEKTYANTDSPEVRALNLIGSMAVAFKVGEPDGLSLEDIKASCEYLNKNDGSNGSYADVFAAIQKAMKFYGESYKTAREERKEQSKARAELYRQTTQDARDILERDNVTFADRTKISIGELYVASLENGGKLYEKDFIPSVWKMVVSYRDLVHQYHVKMHSIDVAIDGDDEYISPTTNNANEIMFMSPMVSEAYNYGKPNEFTTGLEYAEISEAEAARLEAADVKCIFKIGKGDAAQTGVYVTEHGMVPRDGRTQAAVAEDFLWVGLAVAVKCAYDEKTRTVDYDENKQEFVPYGSLILDPYAIDYTTVMLDIFDALHNAQ